MFVKHVLANLLFYLILGLVIYKCTDIFKKAISYRSDRELFGSNNQYLPKIVRVFAEV